MTDISVDFHDGQGMVWNSPARFKVVMAGRRYGKTYYMVRDLSINVLKTEENGRSLRDFPVYYVAPTRDNAKRNTWRHFKNFLAPVTDRVYEKDLIIRVINGRELYLHGADSPDSLRGDALHRVGLDEFADMKEEVWGEVIRPMLADVKGGAVFIGTRKPACNLQRLAESMRNEPDWEVFRFDSYDNPFIDKDEIDAARRILSKRQFIQEFRGSGAFESGEVFTMEHFDRKVDVVPPQAWTYIAMDPAGFKTSGQGPRRRIRSSSDYHAIAVVSVFMGKWYVRDIDYGHWDTREAATHLLQACRKYQPMKVGIERGALANAMGPYLTDLQRKFGIYVNIEPLTHGGQQKAERIRWALEGRFEKGNIAFTPGEYLKVLRDEAMNFPNPLEHDDLLDALAYIDQLVDQGYTNIEDSVQDYWNPEEWELI